MNCVSIVVAKFFIAKLCKLNYYEKNYRTNGA